VTSKWFLGGRRVKTASPLSRNSRGWARAFVLEDLEGRWVMDGTGFPQNECPPNLQLTGIAAQTATVGQAFSLNLLTAGGTIEDLRANGTPTNDTIRYLLDPDPDDTPAGATITAAGVFTWTPTASQVGNHTIVVLAVDAGTPPLADAETFVINVVAASTAPVVDLNGSGTGTGFTATFTEDSGGVLAVDTDLSVTSTGNLNSATIRITNFTAGSLDTLSVDTTGVSAITAGSFNTTNGTLTLTGQATAAQYQQVLRTLRFNSASQNPSTTPRTIEVVVTAGTGTSAVSSAAAVSTINITAVDDAPNLASIPNQQSQVGQTFELVVNATDAEGNPFTFTLDRDDPGTNIPASATITQNGNSATIRWVVDQAGIFNFVVLVTQTGTGALADREEFTLTTTSAAPVVDLNGPNGTGTGFTVTFTEDGGAITIVDSDATITDSNSTMLASATITLQERPDGPAEFLSVTAASGTTATYVPTTGVLTITGTASLADYETMLRSLRYNNTSQDPSTADRTVRIVVSDGVSSSTAADAVIQVVAVADPPQLVVPSEFTNAANPFTVTAGMPISFVATASDAESTSNELTFSLDLTGSGILAADPQPSITSPPSAVPGGSFSWTPTGLGTFSFDVVVTDPGGASTRVEIHITVEAARSALSMPALSLDQLDFDSKPDMDQGDAIASWQRVYESSTVPSDELDGTCLASSVSRTPGDDCSESTTRFVANEGAREGRLESFEENVDELFASWESVEGL
jgi:hypothetical protein